MTYCLLPVHRYSSEKGFTLKGKKNAPLGRKFFPFRVDLFSEVSKLTFVFLKGISVPLSVYLKCQILSTVVISKSKGLCAILRDVRTSTYQICRIEETINRTTTFHK